VHWITRISVVGIAVTTAALVILISAFNGIEQMVEKLYSDFDADIVIRPAQRKTFYTYEIDTAQLASLEEVRVLIPAVEETVVLKHEQKWVNAKLLGVDDRFLDLSKMDEHMVDGFPVLSDFGEPNAIVGASLLDKLGGFVPSVGYESLIFYAPKRNVRMKLGASPFKIKRINVSGRVNFNREVNVESVVIPIETARELLGYKNESSQLLIGLRANADPEDVKEKIKVLVGKNFVVKTRFEKNELIYKTSQSEKIIVIIILLFVFVIAAFTLVAALTMLFLEKKQNLLTLSAIGADKSMLFRVILLEGLLIATKGVFIGFLIGYGVCALQIFGELLIMPNSAGEAFPVVVKWKDGIFILSMVFVLSFLASYLPSKFLVRAWNKSET
jgi:lipoprotein-releasing system permease protein